MYTYLSVSLYVHMYIKNTLTHAYICTYTYTKCAYINIHTYMCMCGYLNFVSGILPCPAPRRNSHCR